MKNDILDKWFQKTSKYMKKNKKEKQKAKLNRFSRQ
jgi:hypothetical protein